MGADYLTRVFVGIEVGDNDFAEFTISEVAECSHLLEGYRCYECSEPVYKEKKRWEWKKSILPHLSQEILNLKAFNLLMFAEYGCVIEGCKFYNLLAKKDFFFGIEIFNIKKIGCKELDFETIYKKKSVVKTALKKLGIDKEVKLIANLDCCF